MRGGQTLSPFSSPRLGYYVIGLGVILQSVGLAAYAWMHNQDPDRAAEEGILTLSNPSHLLLALGMALVITGVVFGLVSYLSPKALAAFRAAIPALAPLAVGVVSLGSVVFAYQLGGFSPDDSLVASDEIVHNQHDPSSAVLDPGDSQGPSGDHDEHEDDPGGGSGDSSTDDGGESQDPGHDEHPAVAPDDDDPSQEPTLADPSTTCLAGYYWHAGLGHCMQIVATATPARTPGGCPAGFVWHPAMGGCMSTSCPSGYVWNAANFACDVAPSPTPGASTTPARTPTGTIPAPTATSTPLGGCPAGFIWHPAKEHCMSMTCPPGFVWNPETYFCELP